MSCHLNSGQNQNIRIANESFENMTKFKCLGTALTNQEDVHDEIRECSLPFSPESFVFPCYIQKQKIKIYRTVIFPITSGEEHRLRVFENRVLRKIF
jgi:hypothetical protein